MTTDAVEVEVIIPTRDRPHLLTATLDALARQSFHRFSIIVVDDGGATDIQRVATRAGMPEIRIIRNEATIGAGASRNRGVAASRAPLVVFLDDDCIADTELIGGHRRALASDGRVVSLGPILSPPGQRMPVWTHWDSDRLEREYSRITRGDIIAEPKHLYTGNIGLHRADFLAVGGFDERFARQEDIELGYRLSRLGCRFQFDPAAVVWHDSRRSLRTWARIPAASARFDILMDHLDPESHRLSAVRQELRAKHWALRLVRSMSGPPSTQRCVIAAATAAGRALHAVRAERAGLAAFSLVWDLIYSCALTEAASDPSWTAASP